MQAFKCDNCGNLYEHMRNPDGRYLARDGGPEFLSMFGVYNQGDKSPADLCTECYIDHLGRYMSLLGL